MPKFDHPKLVNRGTAGLITKVQVKDEAQKLETQQEREDRILAEAPKDRVAPSLKGLLVPIASLNPDPANARLHPEKNLRAVMLSLAMFGQRKVIAVAKKGRVVIAGNGTLEAAKALGWTKIAAAVDDDLDAAQLAAYGLADNRSAEHARWDFEVVAKLEKMISQSGGQMIGWSLDELEVLRAADWTEIKPASPEDFPEVGEDIEVDHICPKCGYQFSGGETIVRGEEDGEA
jgi:ParB-like nuclease domain